MKKQIIIQVLGISGIGKTTISEMIKELFDLYGINTEFNDPDNFLPSLRIHDPLSDEEKKINKRNRIISVINSLDNILIVEKQDYVNHIIEYMRSEKYKDRKMNEWG